MKLTLDSVSKYYKDVAAVRDFSATLSPGIYGLLGPNGSGKTTLMRMICNVLRPSRGDIFYNGEPIDSMDARYREILGYLPQQFGYYPNFTAKNFLMYFAALKGLAPFSAEERSEELLEMGGLSSVKNKKLKTLSGGMLQRVGVAQALLNDPQVLILDEPTAGLDPKERIRLRNLISSFSSDRIVVFSTHIVSDLEHIADHFLIMREGSLMRKGTAQELAHEMQGKVWEMKATQREAESLEERLLVSGRRSIGEQVALRIVCDTKPSEEATLVSPSLEDFYLYHFQED